SQVDRPPARDHRLGQGEGLRRREPAEVDGHAERGHLIIGNIPAHVGEHELTNLVGVQLLAVALALDELRRPDHEGFAALSPRAIRAAASQVPQPTSGLSSLSESRWAAPEFPWMAPCLLATRSLSHQHPRTLLDGHGRPHSSPRRTPRATPARANDPWTAWSGRSRGRT